MEEREIRILTSENDPARWVYEMAQTREMQDLPDFWQELIMDQWGDLMVGHWPPTHHTGHRFTKTLRYVLTTCGDGRWVEDLIELYRFMVRTMASVDGQLPQPGSLERSADGGADVHVHRVEDDQLPF